MSYRKKLLQFWDKNAVVLVTVPLLIAVHWTWMKLQDVPYLVKPEDKRDLPIIIGAKYVEKQIVEEFNTLTGRSQDSVEEKPSN